MLSTCLRPSKLPFPISEEYPLVLSNLHFDSSYCIFGIDPNQPDQEIVLAHANLWIRQLRSRPTDQFWPVGLIGNVATHPSYQGQGLMKQAFTWLNQQAKTKNLSALILWSDLQEFYQKLGFESLAREARFRFSNMTDLHCDTSHLDFGCAPLAEVEQVCLAEILRLRYLHPVTLDRSLLEFEQLSRIPATFLFFYTKNDKISSYLIIGKGYDMVGVAHEWGCSTATELISLIGFAQKVLHLEDVTLLAPQGLPEDLFTAFSQNAAERTEHPMALFKPLSRNAEFLKACDKSFIWGLDSI